MKKINFDMDGTIADLYSVNEWLSKLRENDPSPYAEAKPLLNMSALARVLNRLIREGNEVRVISWASMDATPEYFTAIEQAKREWLRHHLPSVQFTEIIITEYGVPKHEIGEGILFDDNEKIRADWGEGAYTENEIMEILKGI